LIYPELVSGSLEKIEIVTKYKDAEKSSAFIGK
jgi:hypothetical protein